MTQLNYRVESNGIINYFDVIKEYCEVKNMANSLGMIDHKMTIKDNIKYTLWKLFGLFNYSS